MRTKRETVLVNETKYTILRSYGHRKDGYLYLVTTGEEMYMMKEYDQNCLLKVLENYHILKNLGIRMPKYIEADLEKGILIKECIDGKSAYVLLQNGELEDTFLDQLRYMAERVEKENLCLDYFPTQFVCEGKDLYYIHYGCDEKNEKNCFSSCVKRFWIERNGLCES
ncbi:MAG: hypothetical protein Q4C49_03670 [Bacillota bacterium]|nr:hypothetical protein [Bacillota bacterium]